MKFAVRSYLTISVWKEVEAKNKEEARDKAQNLEPPRLCYHCSSSDCGGGGGEENTWNPLWLGFDKHAGQHIDVEKKA